jgi:[ribosomal protein S5]-alanine N-acetyltransferase
VEVRGPSLSLRYATLSDVPALFVLGSDPEVTRFFSWGPYTSPAQPAAYVERVTAARERGERLEFLIVDADDAPIGVTGLSELSQRDRRAVVGTWLGRRHWGTGANRESKALVARLAFEGLGLTRLGAYADVENPRSQVALTRLGFEREGVLRSWHRHDGRVRDVVLYSLLSDQWRRSALARVKGEIHREPPAGWRIGPDSV